MRKIVLSLAVSLDGFIEGPNGEYDWCFSDQDYGMSDFFNRIDSIIMGRKTYEMTLGMKSNDSGMPKMKSYVVSNKLSSLQNGGTLITGDIKKQIGKIKKSQGKDIWLFGGAELTTSLINFRLVDEIQLAVHPILLGGGKPLFQNIQKRIKLHLMDSKTYSTGLISITYYV